MSDHNRSHAKASTGNAVSTTASAVSVADLGRQGSGDGSGEVSRASDGAGTVAPIRRMTMTPLEPRTAGGLKGFGFTVRFDDPPEAA